MALTEYQTRVRNLLQNPAAPTSLYATSDVLAWINQARGQLAGEGRCIRAVGTISTVVGQRPYDFSGINVGVSATTGRAGAIHVRSVRRASGTGTVMLAPRPWEWMEWYGLNNVAPANGTPTIWSQYGQGSAGTATQSDSSGSFYLDPPPSTVLVLSCDCVCYPIALVDNTTIEALPYLWTDAVPYFAAYLALLSAQMQAREADAMRMLERYQFFVERARRFSTPEPDGWQYSQSPDPISAKNWAPQAGAQR